MSPILACSEKPKRQAVHLYNTDGQLRPFILNDEQLGVINDNPLLDFEPKLSDYPEYYDLGYVRHTVLPEQIGEVLQAICDEYNQGYLAGKDPHQLAAKFQQDITFLKPFTKGNDLISSLLMNWSLENTGYTPSASLPTGKDVFATEEKWAETVRNRSRDTFNMLQHIETGEVNPAVLLGVTHEQSRYATGEPQYTSATPQLVQRLEPGSYFRYLTFLDQLNKPRSIGHPSQSAPSNWEDEVLQIQYFQNYQREVAKYKHLPKASKPASQSIRTYPRTEGIFGILRQQVGRDFVLHGSAELNIPELEPRTTQNLHVDHATGELVDPNKAVFATTDPTLAIFYATVFAPVRQTGLRRNVGVKGVTDTNGITIGYLYFASNPAKEIVRKCLLAGKPSSVYHIERKGCHYYSDSAEWVRHSSARVCGYLAVTALSLPFDVFGLPHPLSDPDIRAFVEKFG